MNEKVITVISFVAVLHIAQINCENLPATKVFILPIEPSMFNWTMKIGDDFSYRATLLNAPDLPKWIEYLYSKRHKTGFLYGVPPRDHKDLRVELIGLNRRTYETRRRVIHLIVQDMTDSATHHVHLKIDNLNVEDFFVSNRMYRLLNIFKYKLWKESFFDLYCTFLTSAVSLGARLPLRPTEGEGVVIRLGSVADFSNTLVELQEEVKPLWKLQFCPRDFKRTTVERIFRDEGFILDWCNFRLVRESVESLIGNSSGNFHETSIESEFFKQSTWSRPTKAEVLQRSYAGEFAFTILIPALIMILLIVLLSLILGFQREGTKDESDDFFNSIFLVCEDYCRSKKKSEVSTSQFISNPSGSSSNFCNFSPELNGTSRSRTSSPHFASRTVVTNNMTRPTPPPYTGGMRTTVVDF